MNKIVDKVLFHPVFYGSMYGAIPGVFTGLIISNEFNKPRSKMVQVCGSIGAIVGSSAACISCVSNMRQKLNLDK